jgi:RNA polymerase sigma factor (sigma-70 family)
MAEPTLDLLRDGDIEGAWHRFIDDYRRLLFSVIRRFARDPDEAMDLFAHLCEQLRADGMARLRSFRDDTVRSASFSTWLVVVARRLIIDWYRKRDGRIRRTPPRDLSPLGVAIYTQVFVAARSHRDAYEWARAHLDPSLTYSAFLRELRAVHQVTFREPAGSVTRAVLELAEIDPAPSAEESFLDEEAAAALNDAMATLDPAVRAAVQLLIVEEMTAGEVARVVGWPNAKAVYNRVYRALAAVRARLAAGGSET